MQMLTNADTITSRKVKVQTVKEIQQYKLVNFLQSMFLVCELTPLCSTH